MPKKRSPVPLNSDSTIYDLVATEVLDELSHPELVVFLRVLAAVARYPGEKQMPIRNAELHRDARTAGRALVKLCKRNLIAVVYEPVRTVEIL